MTDEDDVARDLVQRAHAAEVRPDFDVEAGLSEVLARAGVLQPAAQGPVTSHTVTGGARRPIELESGTPIADAVTRGRAAFARADAAGADTAYQQAVGRAAGDARLWSALAADHVEGLWALRRATLALQRCNEYLDEAGANHLSLRLLHAEILSSIGDYSGAGDDAVAIRAALKAQPNALTPDDSARLYRVEGLLAANRGVSLGDIIRRKGGRSFHADLPGPVRRAGLFDEASRLDLATGSGQITQVSIDGSGHVKVWRAESVEFQGEEPDELVVRKDVNTVIQWRRGPVDWVRRALESIHNRLVSRPAAGLPIVKDGVLYSYQDVSGRILYKIGGPDDPWLSITNERTPPGEERALRLGAPDLGTGQVRLLAELSPCPDLAPVGGVPPQWINVTPATPDSPARLIPAGPPGSDARTVRVTTPDGRTATISQIGDHALARCDDPILGLNGTTEGAALLRDFPRVDEAMRSAGQTNDGLLRGVRLGKDGVALVGADGVIPAAADHPWANRVQQAFGPGPSPQVPLFRIEGNAVLHVDPSELTIRPGSTQRKSLDEVLNTASGDIYLHRSMLVFEDDEIAPNTLPLDTTVTVQEFAVADRPSAEATASQPDVLIHEDAEWRRMSVIGVESSVGAGSTASPGSGVVPAASRTGLLVRPETNENIRGGEE